MIPHHAVHMYMYRTGDQQTYINPAQRSSVECKEQMDVTDHELYQFISLNSQGCNSSIAV